MTLESHPEWLTYEDCQHLLRLYMGHGFGRRLWDDLVVRGKLPGYRSTLSQQTRHRWAEVLAAVEGSMKKVVR